MCNEVPGYELGDQATRIFLNTRGKNREEIPEELRAFLDYIEDTTEETAMKSGSDRILRIHRRVCEVKENEEMGLKYLRMLEEQEDARAEGREEAMHAIAKSLLGKLDDSEIAESTGLTVEEVAKLREG